jgi:restriction system protein
MDYSAIVKAVSNPLWWLVPFVVVLTILRSPWFKGIAGETLVRFAAYLRLPSDTYHSIHNVTLQTPGGTTQIDHILVSRFGIFVVETKHMKGWIFGTERDAEWTQKLFKSSFKFQNPLRQNYKHVKALELSLGVPANVIHSVIVFSGAATFKTLMPVNVVSGGGYIGFIKSFQKQVLSNAQVEEVLGKIQASQLPPTSATRRLHINNLRSRRAPSVDRRCPRCGNRMILRTAKQGRNAGGQFWGCSSFPKCKAVQSNA